MGVFFPFTVEAVAALGNKVVETLRTQDPTEGNTVRTVVHVLKGLRKVGLEKCML